ncbi:MAG TPA: MBOAT family O-acyltransferase [Polyangiales bacterium]|nr:MBOAT family O-acyltransferase [Polyangiales bacterium]
MLFNSLQFALFFLVLLGVLRALRGFGSAVRLRVLLGASLLFYTLWIPSYLLLLMATLGINYWLASVMLKSAQPRRVLITSIVFSLGLLAVFKYAALAVETALPALRLIGVVKLQPPELLLPLGISFYTFEIISLSVDIYKRRGELPSFTRYVLFVTFFPHLIAGPIMRGNELLPQFDSGGVVDPVRTRRGSWLIAAGLLKKCVLADFLLAPFVNDVFGVAGAGTAPAHLIAVYSFAFQIYFDFSGYTDMARGLACLLGFELPHNFLEPYLSRSASEFWRRWHISLSRWLRDYLYIPLGGNRSGELRTGINLMLTMLLGGLWHGAGWNYVVWGGLHGALLMIERALGKGSVSESVGLRWRDAPRIVLMFHLVCLIWVAFRAPDLSTTLTIWSALFTRSYFVAWPLLPLLIVFVCALLHLAERAVHARLPALHTRIAGAVWGPMFEGAALGAIVGASLVAAGAGAEFIYFQF